MCEVAYYEVVCCEVGFLEMLVLFEWLRSVVRKKAKLGWERWVYTAFWTLVESSGRRRMNLQMVDWNPKI